MRTGLSDVPAGSLRAFDQRVQRSGVLGRCLGGGKWHVIGCSDQPEVGSTGLEQPAFRAGNTAVVISCDAKCDAISANRIELLTRAVILVAGMNLAEAERAAVLARVIADLTSPTQRIPE